MSPTLSPESLVIIDKISSRVFPPKRSEIIVYRNEQKGIRVKRVIGLPGENIQIKNGGVFAGDNDISIEEKYLGEHVRTCVPGSCTNLQEHLYDIPPEKYFVLGDNRENSRDSRGCDTVTDCENKTPVYVTSNEILGRVIFSW